MDSRLLDFFLIGKKKMFYFSFLTLILRTDISVLCHFLGSMRHRRLTPPSFPCAPWQVPGHASKPSLPRPPSCLGSLELFETMFSYNPYNREGQGISFLLPEGCRPQGGTAGVPGTHKGSFCSQRVFTKSAPQQSARTKSLPGSR